MPTAVPGARPASRARAPASRAPPRSLRRRRPPPRASLPHRGSRGLRRPDASAAPAAPPAPTPVTIGDLGTVEIDGRRDDGLRPHRRQARPVAVGLEDLERQHRRRSPTRSPPSSTSWARSTRTPCRSQVVSDLSTFIKESRDGLLREGGLGALFAILTIFLFLFSIRSTHRGRGQHPALDPHGARDHAGDRRHPQHHDPGRPGGRRGTGRGRRDRRPREHLPPSGAGRGPPDGVDQRPQGGRRRDHRGDGHHRRRVPAARLRRRARVASSSCPSRSRSPSRCSPRSCAP